MQTDAQLQHVLLSHRWKKWLLFVGVVGIVLGLDQATKRYIHTSFALYESHAVIDGFLNLTYVRNSGAAFGFLARQEPAFLRLFFLSVTTVALIVLVIYYTRVPWPYRLTLCGISLITAGALGNGIDRLWLGQVIDFIDVYVHAYHWPSFNVADSAICVGVGCLLLDTLRRPAA
jgi:signal peptidase II